MAISDGCGVWYRFWLLALLTLTFATASARIHPIHTGLMPATIAFKETEKGNPQQNPPAVRPRKLGKHTDCRDQICRITVNGFVNSQYVYGQLEIHRDIAKGFLYLPDKQVYVYGKAIKDDLFLVKDGEGLIYRLVPAENYTHDGPQNRLRKSKIFKNY